VAYNGTTKRIAIAGSALRLRQADGSLVTLPGYAGPVLCVAFSPDGQWLLSGGSDGRVCLWHAGDGRELHCFEGHADKVHTVAWGPNQRSVYSGSADGTLRRWVLPS
jgi:WD40 repeat protein